MIDTILALDSTLDEYVKQLRQRIHQHPELAFEETKTSALVASELAAYGYEVTTGIAKTGVVAVRRFGNGPSVAIRADMDALPIKEQNDVPHASRRDGCMHACGHDGHTAMLLGAAKVLSSRADLIGTLILIFQPAEENEGGALAMLEDGLLERFPIDQIYGLHNMPGVPLGTYQVRSGPLLASFDRFDIELSSSGGHGAFPNLSKDGVLAASSLVLALTLCRVTFGLIWDRRILRFSWNASLDAILSWVTAASPAPFIHRPMTSTMTPRDMALPHGYELHRPR